MFSIKSVYLINYYKTITVSEKLKLKSRLISGEKIKNHGESLRNNIIVNTQFLQKYVFQSNSIH